MGQGKWLGYKSKKYKCVVVGKKQFEQMHSKSYEVNAVNLEITLNNT